LEKTGFNITKNIYSQKYYNQASKLAIANQAQPQSYEPMNQGLRGSTNPVLTATGLVNGTWQFSAPYRIDTP